MAIDYSKVGWTANSYVNPVNMDKMDSGIKAACDGVDALAGVPDALQKNGVGEVSGGKNLWDEKWDVGSFYGDGAEAPSILYVRSSRVKVKPNTVYYCAIPIRIWIYPYTETNELIGQYVTINSSRTYTTPSNCEYIRFLVDNAYGTTYKHDIAIIEGTSGTYEPYFESNKMLTEDVNEMASLKFLGWTVPREMPIKNYVDGQGKFHQRVGRVDLGSLSWANQTTNRRYSEIISNLTSTRGAECYVVGYSNSGDVSSSDMGDKTYQTIDRRIYIVDSSYTDATAFRSAMNGKYFYYPLATEVFRRLVVAHLLREVKAR